MRYTHHNNELRASDIGKTVTLKGFVSKKRDLGNLVFIDLRDEKGITQLAFYTENPFKSITTGIKNEYVLEASGKVVERSSKNPDLPTGDIEVDVSDLKVLSTAKQSPMIIQDETDALEDTRLKYRYLDLRRPRMKRMLRTRHEVIKATRDFLNAQDFIDFDTPILTKSTPEGARDYIVPSRIHKGGFYALPQSPQLFKQLLMIGGFERYYQIAKCFRDEDLRSDRQPEFTQIDIEMAFVEEDDVLTLSEGMIKHIMKATRGIDIKTPFPRITYDEAMRLYGTDKPDLRFALPIMNLGGTFRETDFKVFRRVLENNGAVQGIHIEGGAKKISRKQIDAHEKAIKAYGAKGLAFIKRTDDDFSGSVAKFLSAAEKEALASFMNPDDLLLIVADSLKVTRASLGHLRNRLGSELGLIDPDTFDFHWVIHWPMFEYNEEEERFQALHHPFTRPRDEDKDKLRTTPETVLTYGYDLVAQGQELGGGSLRNHNVNVQNAVFDALGMDKETQISRFGFLIDALEYGAPPHGGIAFGLERLVMMIAGTKNIRDVIAFPKTASATCLLTDAPSDVDASQLEELGLTLKEKDENGE
ncbi:MAG: aspartate--tRNA ligase [Bacillota bacterium]